MLLREVLRGQVRLASRGSSCTGISGSSLPYIDALVLNLLRFNDGCVTQMTWVCPRPPRSPIRSGSALTLIDSMTESGSKKYKDEYADTRC